MPKQKCPKGFHWNAGLKRCVRDPDPPKEDKPKDKDKCPEGYYWDKDKNKCVKLAEDPGICPEGYHWNAKKGECVIDHICPPGMVWDGGQCRWPDAGACPDGFHPDQTGQCVPNERADCPPGYGWNDETSRCEFGFDDGAGDGDCPEGFTWDETIEDCVPDEEEQECPEGYKWDDTIGVCLPDPAAGDAAQEKQALLDSLSVFLEQYGLTDLLPFVQEAIELGKSYNQIILEIRDHPVYRAAFPEMALREDNGLSFMSEGEILAYRDEAKRLGNEILGALPTENQIAAAIGAGVSVAELEHRFEIGRQINQFGPIVRTVLEQELGANLSDEDLYEFFDPNLTTSQWDEAYLNALYRGRPANLGLGVRSQAEADALKMLGVDPDEAFSRYEAVGMEASRMDRLKTIEGDILAGLPDDFGNFMGALGNDFLVNAIVFQQPEYLAQLQILMSREVARHNQGGGAVAGLGAAPGLLTEAQRQQG